MTAASTDLPLALPCRGATSATHLAVDVAAVLDRLGVAEAAGDLGDAVEAAHRGRRVVALDGCASACRARLLAARGAVGAQSLNLADLSADGGGPSDDVLRLAHAAAARLQRPSPLPPPGRVRRPARTPEAGRHRRAHDVGDYLLAIDALGSASVACGAVGADAPTLAAHVSLLVGVSRPSAGEALARLEAKGLVARGGQKEVLLTGRGRVAADRVVRRQRLLERFVVDYLGYPPGESFERARMIGRAFDGDAIERLHARLCEPERCPHGWPVDPPTARAESERLTTLLAVPAGERARVVRIVEQDQPVACRLFDLGVAPGVDLAVERRSERLGVSVRIDGARRKLDADTAAAALVEATGPESAR